ncbi:hypothetical protein CR513_04277, partial [Mucuna pruriens]
MCGWHSNAMSTTYTVHAAYTVASISDSVNNINATNPLTCGGTLVIPLPCTCYNNVNNGGTAIYVLCGAVTGELGEHCRITLCDILMYCKIELYFLVRSKFRTNEK